MIAGHGVMTYGKPGLGFNHSSSPIFFNPSVNAPVLNELNSGEISLSCLYCFFDLIVFTHIFTRP
ncbi:hypothetical protein, partial [Pseudomonas viridiflava]|uniref:hypothetical protein n=1 Tax=Pseudomonas viridiflava TaxID=33069 RepID=UPI00197F0DAB